MTIELAIPRFEADGRCSNYIADGSDGFVYSIGRGFAAKVPAGPKNWRAMQHYGYVANSLIGKANHEFRIGERLYQEGVSVPKPEGVFLLDVPERNGNRLHRNVPAYVMALVEGVRIDKIKNKRQQRKARALRDAEVERSKNFCYPSRDALTDCNALFLPEEKRVVLIDFIGWELRA